MKDITEDRINELKSSIHLLRSYLSVWFFEKRKQIVKKDLQEKINQMYETNTNIGKEGQRVLNNKKKLPDVKKSQKKREEKQKSLSQNIEGKVLVMPGECIVNQGDEGRSAFLILSGSMNVEIDKKVVGAMSSGEIFGELSLILGDKRKATIRAITGTELIEIDPSFLDDFLLSSDSSSKKISQSRIQTKKLIKEFAIELGKKNEHKISVSKEELINIISEESDIIQCLALQLHKRLTKMIADQEKKIVAKKMNS